MKKFSLFLFMILFIIMIPLSVWANSPVPRSTNGYIYYKNIKPGCTVRVLTAGRNGNYHTTEDFQAEKKHGLFMYYRSENDVSICIAIIRPGEKTVRSNELQLEDHASYSYDGKTNLLSEGLDPMAVFDDKLRLIISGILIITAFFFTLIIELVTGLFFNMGSYRFIVAANAMTNIPMNIALVAISFFISGIYLPALIIFELTVPVLEFLYYRKRYSDQKQRKIIIYVITANIASLLIGRLAFYYIVPFIR